MVAAVATLQTGIIALLMVDAILVGWRDGVVRMLPQTAPFYALLGMPVNLQGITFDGVVTSTERRDNVPILVVEGNIVNSTRKVVDVPDLNSSSAMPRGRSIPGLRFSRVRRCRRVMRSLSTPVSPRRRPTHMT